MSGRPCKLCSNPEAREKAVEMRDDGASFAAIGAELGIGSSSVHRCLTDPEHAAAAETSPAIAAEPTAAEPEHQAPEVVDLGSATVAHAPEPEELKPEPEELKPEPSPVSVAAPMTPAVAMKEALRRGDFPGAMKAAHGQDLEILDVDPVRDVDGLDQELDPGLEQELQRLSYEAEYGKTESARSQATEKLLQVEARVYEQQAKKRRQSLARREAERRQHIAVEEKRDEENSHRAGQFLATEGESEKLYEKCVELGHSCNELTVQFMELGLRRHGLAQKLGYSNPGRFSVGAIQQMLNLLSWAVWTAMVQDGGRAIGVKSFTPSHIVEPLRRNRLFELYEQARQEHEKNPPRDRDNESAADRRRRKDRLDLEAVS